MKTFTLLSGMAVLCYLLFLSLFIKGVASPLTTSPQKIDIAAAVAQGQAALTSTPWYAGPVDNCFDGDIHTEMITSNRNPAFVQVAFTTPQSVKKIQALPGEPFFPFPYLHNSSWWLEAADTQQDMDTHSGTYRIVVPRRDDVHGIWDVVVLPEAVEAKIWKFTVERTTYDNWVHIAELELWSEDDEFEGLEPVYETIDPFMATPADNAANIIPVLIIRFLPTADGLNLDVSKVPDFWGLGKITLQAMEEKIDQLNKRIKFMLEEGSKYHGYKDPDAQPMTGYQVVEDITVYELTPPGTSIVTDRNGYPVYKPDYFQIFERFNVEHYVNDLGVKHIWIWDGSLDSSWPSYDPNIHAPANFRGSPEANMASPITGDISNSYRDNNDLPIYDHTYIVFGNNYRRTQNEAVGHNYGHQIEHMLKYVDLQDNGEEDLFWQKFVGADENLQSVTGRCGWNHMPPNTIENYDYLNPTLVESDIEDWRPDNSGEKKEVNVDTWRNLQYDWPDGSRPYPIDPGEGDERTTSHWHMYWMQALPGAESKIPYQEEYIISDWWNIFANWDEAITTSQRLYEAAPPTPISFRLIDAETDLPALDLYDGYFASFVELPTSMAIEAVPSEPVGSIRIEVSGPGIQSTRNQSEAPYASFGDEAGDFKGMPSGVGVYHVKATPYSGENGTGVAGEPTEISFEFLAPPIAPVARLTATPIKGSAPLTILFDASGSTDEDGEITQYIFIFGDGTRVQSESPSVTHTYATAGEYEVLVNVRDNERNGGATSTLITVIDEPTPGTTFRLIDAQTDAVIANLTEGAQLSKQSLPESLAIEVLPNEPVGSFKIKVVGPGLFHIKNESAPPYASFGDDDGDFDGKMLTEGIYTVTATPYSGPNATGVPGTPSMISFSISIQAPDLQIAGFKLINTEQDISLYDDRVLTNKITLNLLDLPEEGLGILAIPSSKAGSIAIDVSGPGISTSTIENAPPYSAFGDDGDDIFGKQFSTGTYYITATSYSDRNALGTAGALAEFEIEIQSCDPPIAHFTAIPTSGKVPLEVSFLAAGNGSDEGQSQEYIYQFDFGDGTVRNANLSTTHTYAQTGMYTVMLTVTNLSNGCSSFTTQTITVEEFITPNDISFRLIDAQTDQPIGDLTDGTKISSSELSESLAIEVLPNEPVGSFKIKVVGPGLFHIKNESAPPYASFGDDDGDFDGKMLAEGIYTVTATPYSGQNATGVPGTPSEISFEIMHQTSLLSGSLVFTPDVPANARQPVFSGKSVAKSLSQHNSTMPEDLILTVYPNPAHSYVEVDIPIPDDQEYTLQIYNMYGRLVISDKGYGQRQEALSLHDQPAGTYLIAVETGGRRVTSKLLLHD
uniref:PKD domain-containing protein n=1 Tax=Roseihalotalea indica TaxID=2867963 RepID=A0AA49GNZ6_9BACT|nr:PKD domain-containing protein [Tunicatimonas sp. TK19036]